MELHVYKPTTYRRESVHVVSHIYIDKTVGSVIGGYNIKLNPYLIKAN
jgi:hypothetical protein